MSAFGPPLILGIGNYILGDWGLGGHYCETFSDYWAERGCDTVFLPTGRVYFHALPLLVNRESVYVLAGVPLGCKAGTSRCLGWDDAATGVLLSLDQHEVISDLISCVRFIISSRTAHFAMRMALFEPVTTCGCRLSTQAKRIMRPITRDAESFLTSRGLKRSRQVQVLPMRRIPMLQEFV